MCVGMYACRHECMYISVYVQITYILFQQDCDINKHEQYYNQHSIICKNKATQKGESR